MWEDLKPASFQADGYPEIKFPVRTLDKSGGKRLARRKRPYRAGAKLDNVGRREHEYAVEAFFANTIDEPGLDTDAQPLWPDRINKLEEQLAADVTGTLHLPWERNIRCQADTWRRSAVAGERDAEKLAITFVEDTEEQLLGDVAEQVGARSRIRTAAEDAVFDAESLGAWDGSFEDFTQLAADLEGALAAPGEFLDDVKHKAARVRRAAQAIRRSVESRAGSIYASDSADVEQVQRRVSEIEDMAAQAEAQAAGAEKQVVTRTFATSRDIFDIASSLGQDAREIMSLNGDIDDLSAIPAGTPVKVYA